MRLVVPFAGNERRKCIDFFARNISLGDRGFAPEAKAVYDYDELETAREYQDALDSFYHAHIILAIADRTEDRLHAETNFNIRRNASKQIELLQSLYFCEPDDWPEHFVDKYENLKHQLTNINRSHDRLIDIVTDEIIEYEFSDVSWIDIDLNKKYIVIAGE